MANFTGSNRGRIWISKDGVSKMIMPLDLQQYIDNGWHKGHDTDNQKSKNKKWYTNGKEHKIFSKDDVIPDGWWPGMLKREPGRYAKFKYKWYTNGDEQRRFSELNGDIIPEGWHPGQSNKAADKSRKAALGKKRNKQQIENHIKGCKKAWETKIKNGTANKSKSEDNLYDELCSKYGIDNVKRNYNEDPRYPYHCDFYIVSEDLFIELNRFPTHYIEPFDENNNDHLNLLEHCKNNPSNWVEKKLVGVWAGSDVEKRKLAEKNNLNYITIY